MTVTDDVLSLTKTDVQHLSFLNATVLFHTDMVQADYTTDHARLVFPLARGQEYPRKYGSTVTQSSNGYQLTAALWQGLRNMGKVFPPTHLTESSEINRDYMRTDSSSLNPVSNKAVLSQSPGLQVMRAGKAAKKLTMVWTNNFQWLMSIAPVLRRQSLDRLL